MKTLAYLLLMSIMTFHPNYGYKAVEEWKLTEYERCKTICEERLFNTNNVTPLQQTCQPGDLGILNIPDANIYVGLYSDANAFQASGKASVQYYNQYGIKWIADHVNQDHFGSLKYLNIGDAVYVNDVCYTVVDNVYAPNYYSDFSAWIAYIGDSTLVLQTCEGDGARLIRCE